MCAWKRSFSRSLGVVRAWGRCVRTIVCVNPRLCAVVCVVDCWVWCPSVGALVRVIVCGDVLHRFVGAALCALLVWPLVRPCVSLHPGPPLFGLANVWAGALVG